MGAEVEQPLGRRVALDRLEQRRSVQALRLRREHLVGEAPGRVAELRHGLAEHGPLAELEHERAPGGAQRLVDAREHPPQPVDAVGREQPQPRGVLTLAEPLERLVERLRREHARLRLVELAEARVEADGEGRCLQQPVAEAVNGGDPGAVELAGEIVPPALAERVADAGTQLSGRALGVRDHEDRADVEPLVADGADEALDEHARLPRARAGGEEDAAARVDRRLLLGVRDARHQARLTRHIVQRSHHAGQPSPFGSCRTSPPRIRCASSSAVARDRSTCAQNSSSST